MKYGNRMFLTGFLEVTRPKPVEYWVLTFDDHDDPNYFELMFEFDPAWQDDDPHLIRVATVKKNVEETATLNGVRPPGRGWEKHETFVGPGPSMPVIDTWTAWRRPGDAGAYYYSFRSEQEFIEETEAIHAEAAMLREARDKSAAAERRRRLKLVVNNMDPGKPPS